MRNDYILVIVGRAQMGKTTLLYGKPPIGRGIVDWAGENDRVFVLDVDGQCPKGWQFDSANQLRLFLLKELDGKVSSPPGNIYCMRPKSTESIGAFFRLLSPPKPAPSGTIVLDEAHRYLSSKSIQRDLNEIVRVGGNYGQNTIVATRRYKGDVHPSVRSQANAIVSFQQRSDADIRALSDWHGGSETARLKPHHYILLGNYKTLPFSDRLQSLDTAHTPSNEITT